MENRKEVEIDLGYTKQGDDLAWALVQKNGDVVAALKRHAEMLTDASKQLTTIAIEIEKNPLERGQIHICADNHFIWMEGPEDFLAHLVGKELAEFNDIEDEDVDFELGNNGEESEEEDSFEDYDTEYDEDEV